MPWNIKLLGMDVIRDQANHSVKKYLVVTVLLTINFKMGKTMYNPIIIGRYHRWIGLAKGFFNTSMIFIIFIGEFFMACSVGSNT